MVHVSSVHELVDHQIIQHFRRLEHATDIEADHATRRTGTPARTLAAQLQTTKTETAARSEITQSRLESRLRMLDQPREQNAFEGGALGLGMADPSMTDDRQQPIAKPAHLDPSASARKVNAITLAECWQLERGWRKSLWCRKRGPLGESTQDPLAVSVHEMTDHRLAHTARRDHLDPPVVMHTQRKTPRTRAATQGPGQRHCSVFGGDEVVGHVVDSKSSTVSREGMMGQ